MAENAEEGEVSAEPPPPEPPPPPRTVTFTWSVGGVAGLPCNLQTVLCVSSGLSSQGDHLSAPLEEASENPSGWIFEDETGQFTQEITDEFLDQVCNCPVTFKLLDAGEGKENALIGSFSLDPVPFLHEKQTISGEFELKLEEAYLAKWEEPKEGEEPPEEGEDPQPREVLPTIMTLNLSVSELIGPPENAEYWTVLSFEIQGVYALPEKLAVCGNAGPDDPEKSFWHCDVWALGEEMKGMVLTDTRFKPTEEQPEKTEEELAAMEEEEEEGFFTCAGLEQTKATKAFVYKSEMQKPSFQLPEGGRGKTVYRGKMFMTTFRDALNNLGGIWVNIVPNLKEITDPKGPQHPPDAEELKSRFTGKAWLDLRGLLEPGSHKMSLNIPLRSAKEQPVPERQVSGEEAPPGPETFESCQTYVKVKFSLLSEIVPIPGAPDCNSLELVRPKPDLQKFGASSDATLMYLEAIWRSLGVMSREWKTRPPGLGAAQAAEGDGAGGGEDGQQRVELESAEFIKLMKERGSYKALVDELRGSVTRVLREKMKKDPSVVPKGEFGDEKRANFCSESYIVLRENLFRVTREAVESGVHLKDWDPNRQQAREVLAKNADADTRCAHLSFESELCGNYERAARFFQNRLVLEKNKKDAQVWYDYAKFLMRSLARQSSAEEAVRQALVLMKGAPPVGPQAELVRDLRCFLYALLLDRGRLKEAEQGLLQMSAKDRPDPLINFLLGICKFLQGGKENTDRGIAYMGLVSKDRNWFKSCQGDQKAIFQKLSLFTATVEDVDDGTGNEPQDNETPQLAKQLFRLLDYGFPHLCFTVLDEMRVVKPQALERHPQILLAEAKALMIRRNWLAAIDKLTAATTSNTGPMHEASKEELAEAYRDLCECQFQVERFDDAFQSASNATQLVPGLSGVGTAAFAKEASPLLREELAKVYIRLGSVLLLKKRWKPAKDALLRSVDFKSTAEAWAGVAFAEYRSDETIAGSHACYEALMEAKLIDEERSDIWAQLTLLHCRLGSQETADSCFKQCMLNNPTNDELLLEIGMAYLRLGFSAPVAESAARKALSIRDTGRAHDVLGDALARQDLYERAILELQVAIRMLWDSPDVRQVIFEKALNWCEAMRDAPLAESVHIAQRLADQRFQQQQ